MDSQEVAESCALLATQTDPKRKPTPRHLYLFFIVLFSILVPPLAVFIRFGIGTDFFINVLLTVAGYIPGHVSKDMALTKWDLTLSPGA